MKIIVDIQYFGNYTYYKNLFGSSYVTLEQYENYDKRSLINRCIIAGANGPLTLSVPLEKGRLQRTIIRDLRVVTTGWQKTHWKSLLSCYNASPWFQFYSDSLSVLFSRRYTFLVDWNLACMEWTNKALGLELRYELSGEFKKAYLGEDLSDLRRLAKRGENPGGTGIRYRQVYEERTGFIENTAILDMLFCEGPEKTVHLLRRQP